MSGYEILAELKKNALTANIPVIMVSAKNEQIAVVKGLDLGADDYIKKPFGVMELIARINAKLKNKQNNKFSYKDIVIDDEKHVAEANGRSRATGGTGLGLSIVKHICNLYNAELSLTSKLSAGTTVTVVFKNYNLINLQK